LIVAVETGSATKPRFRSDHTSWLTPPVRTAIRGTPLRGSVAGRAPVTRRKVRPCSLPVASRRFFADTSKYAALAP
jgi:hypothetical protein